MIKILNDRVRNNKDGKHPTLWIANDSDELIKCSLQKLAGLIRED